LVAQTTRLCGKPMIELLNRPSLLASHVDTPKRRKGKPLPGVQALSD
jgi:hypothetical protein